MWRNKGHHFSMLVAAGLLLVSSLGIGLTPRNAGAAQGTCRTDPVVTLSNLAIMDFASTIGADASEVTHVTYTLHGPVGTFVVAAIGLNTLPTTFTYKADQLPRQYLLDTLVEGTTQGTVQTNFTALRSMSSASGVMGQTLTQIWP